MKKVFQAFSDLVLPGIVIAAVTAILTGAALFEKIGNRMAAESENFSSMADTQAMETVCDRKEPLIQCIGKKVWKAGEHMTVSNVFSAADEEGRKLKIMVLDIADQNGGSVLNCYQKSTGQAVFTKRGVYTFSLEAMDTERKIGREKIVILVDDR
ncbi:MAG: hypothetical protein HFI70_12505 [Lachnospiraceae bacterium]|nr:hypothetical protein [Lachnospiraceae bacterium]